MFKEKSNQEKKSQRHFIKNGFTLLELIFVVVILLALVMVSTPRFIRTYRNLVFKNFSRDIYDLSQTLQQISVLKGKTIKMFINDENRTVEILTKKVVDNDIVCDYLENRLFKPYKIPDYCSLESSPDVIFFYPDNSVLRATLSLTDRTGREATIVFDDSKGTITLQEAMK